jgi:hypothetical protein
MATVFAQTHALHDAGYAITAPSGIPNATQSIDRVTVHGIARIENLDLGVLVNVGNFPLETIDLEMDIIPSITNLIRLEVPSEFVSKNGEFAFYNARHLDADSPRYTQKLRALILNISSLVKPIAGDEKPPYKCKSFIVGKMRLWRKPWGISQQFSALLLEGTIFGVFRILGHCAPLTVIRRGLHKNRISAQNSTSCMNVVKDHSDISLK